MKRACLIVYKRHFNIVIEGCECMQEDLREQIEYLKAEQKEMVRDIRNLETRITISEKDISTINKQLEKISTNTTWILRIVVSAVVMGVLGLLMKGGM